MRPAGGRPVSIETGPPTAQALLPSKEVVMRRTRFHVIVVVAALLAVAGMTSAALAVEPGPTREATSQVAALIQEVEDLSLAWDAAGSLSLRPTASWEPQPESPACAYSEELPASLIRVEPEYPSLAREARVDGRVLVQVLVGVDGLVQDVQVDPRHSIPMLDEAVIAAARQWVFTPARVCGRPVAVRVSLPFDFKMP
jgi:TonB family protein